MKKVFLIILNRNGKKDTLECLGSVAKSESLDYEVKTVIVDNASSDNSVKEIKSRYKNVTVLENKHNLGFAAGNNIGIKYALKNSADYIIILNNDTIVPKNFFDLLHNTADLVGPVIKFKHNEKWIYDYGGYLNRWIGRPKHHELPRYTLRPKPYSLDYLSGCCLLMKRKVFEKIGLFDERFFLYFEDVDFCLRAQKMGLKIALESNVVIFHKLGGTIGRWSKTAIYHNLRSNFLFISKHLAFRRPIGYLYLSLLSIKIIFKRLILK